MDEEKGGPRKQKVQRRKSGRDESALRDVIQTQVQVDDIVADIMSLRNVDQSSGEGCERNAYTAEVDKGNFDGYISAKSVSHSQGDIRIASGDRRAVLIAESRINRRDRHVSLSELYNNASHLETIEEQQLQHLPKRSVSQYHLQRRHTSCSHQQTRKHDKHFSGDNTSTNQKHSTSLHTTMNKQQLKDKKDAEKHHNQAEKHTKNPLHGNHLLHLPQRSKSHRLQLNRRLSEGMDKLLRKHSFRRYSEGNTELDKGHMQGSASVLTVGSTSIASSISGLTVAGVADDWVPDARPVHSSLPHVGFSARNDDWNK